MSRRTRLPLSADALNWRYRYKASILGQVVTGTEVTEIWQVSRATLDRAWENGRLEARKTLTGGAVLFTVRSIIAVFGKPKVDLLETADLGDKQLSLFELGELAKSYGE